MESGSTERAWVKVCIFASHPNQTTSALVIFPHIIENNLIFGPYLHVGFEASSYFTSTATVNA
jgi:hypothetical protein